MTCSLGQAAGTGEWFTRYTGCTIDNTIGNSPTDTYIAALFWWSDWLDFKNSKVSNSGVPSNMQTSPTQVRSPKIPMKPGCNHALTRSSWFKSLIGSAAGLVQGTLFIDVSSLASFRNSEFEGNRAGIGGAVCVRGTGAAEFHNCLFVRNAANSNGGAISFKVKQKTRVQT